MSGAPAAFMSYARFNDKHDEGQLSQFRERLAAEVQVQTGEEFAIFQDRNDIAWGGELAAAHRGRAGHSDISLGCNYSGLLSELSLSR